VNRVINEVTQHVTKELQSKMVTNVITYVNPLSGLGVVQILSKHDVYQEDIIDFEFSIHEDTYFVMFLP
jgi:hypothetical protein